MARDTGKAKRPLHPDDTRMTIGEHLEELRRCVARSLIALIAVSLPCIWLARDLLAIIARPFVLSQRTFDQPDTFLATGPVEPFLVYFKVVLISGLVIAGPYIIYQLWTFVAAGLYPKERAWVQRLVPFSVGLFLAGILFMYTLALPLSLHFLVGFSNWLKMPDAEPTTLEQKLFGMRDGDAATTQPSGLGGPIPLLKQDPVDPPTGAMWINLDQRRLKIRHGHETLSLALHRDGARPMITTHFTIGHYLSYVLVLGIAFGVAFQMPLIVLFLARSGLAPVATLRRYRKVVILLIVIVAGIIAPPDLLSHLLLSVPMYLLFELGMWLASRAERRKAT
jgi:Sec-independent protein secretion pathway component TatC